jgi:hypothetical protein
MISGKLLYSTTFFRSFEQDIAILVGGYKLILHATSKKNNKIRCKNFQSKEFIIFSDWTIYFYLV